MGRKGFYNPLSTEDSDSGLGKPMSIGEILGTRSDLMGPLAGREEEEYDEEYEEDED